MTDCPESLMDAQDKAYTVHFLNTGLVLTLVHVTPGLLMKRTQMLSMTKKNNILLTFCHVNIWMGVTMVSLILSALQVVEGNHPLTFRGR